MSKLDHLCISLIIRICLLFPIPFLSQANERQMDRFLEVKRQVHAGLSRQTSLRSYCLHLS